MSDATAESSEPSDPHVLGPDLVPTPYTADEIRSASPGGRTVRTLVEPGRGVTGGEGPYVRVSRFVGTTDQSVVFEHWRESVAGDRVGDVVGHTVDWRDLQRHAAFPVQATTVSQETVSTPLGELACLRYDVRDGTATSTFWFEVARPGMPVMSVEEEDGRVVETATMVSDEVS